jgi:AcrR family transcriptional regulator
MQARTGKPLTKRQLRAVETGEQLLVAARETFEARGYAATTVGAITKAADTAHGTFYLHFKNKEDAFRRVMASVLDEMYLRAGPHPGHPPGTPEAIQDATVGYLTVFRAHRGLWRCLLEGMLRSKAIEGMWFEMRQPFIDRIARAIERGRQAGIARAEVHPERAAAALAAMCEWCAFTHFVVGEGDADPDEIADTLADLWFHSVHHPAVGQG